jgi:hypothetical protein
LGRRAIAAWPTLLLAVTSAASLVLLPGAVGLPSPAGSIHAAPYRGSTWFGYYSDSWGGCSGTAKLVKKPFWSNATGIGGFAYATKATACTHPVASGGTVSYANANEQFVASIPIHVAKNGAHRITLNWTITISTSQSLSSSKCPTPVPPSTNSYCSSSTYLFLYAYGYLRDLTNGSSVGSQNYWSGLYNDSNNQSSINCYSGACSYSFTYGRTYTGGPFHGNTSFGWLLNASGYQSLNASHRYVVIVDVYAQSYVGENGYLAGTAICDVNMATGGNGWKLNYLRIV